MGADIAHEKCGTSAEAPRIRRVDSSVVSNVSVVIISKKEQGLSETLNSIEASPIGESCEVVVVDASQGSLSAIRDAHPRIRWIDFPPIPNRSVTIPHQRNMGVASAKGEIIAYTDAGCVPEAEWLERLIQPIIDGDEEFVAGPVKLDGSPYPPISRGAYVSECPTINVAFKKSVWTTLGGFDESFLYGSDIDFSWRAVQSGIRIRWVEDAVVSHDWGSWRRQLRRSYVYGVAKTKLYRKHPGRWKALFTTDPGPLAYACALLGAPLGIIFPSYFLILAIPLWRNRRSEQPLLAVLNGFVFSIGAMIELVNPT